MYTTVVFSQFCPSPCKGHLSKIQHIYGYPNKYSSTSIKFNTEIPVYDNFKTIDVNCGNIYDDEPKDLPHLCPPPYGKYRPGL